MNQVYLLKNLFYSTKISLTSNERLRIAELRMNKQDQRFLKWAWLKTNKANFRIRNTKNQGHEPLGYLLCYVYIQVNEEVYIILGLFYLRLFHADDSGMAKRNKANFRIRRIKSRPRKSP